MCRRPVARFLALSLIMFSSAGAVAGGSAPASRALVNVAVDATATASSETTDHAARLATDGNAATSWCPATSPGTLTIDLGHPEDISGFGISLAGGAASGTVEIALATSPRSFLTLVPTRVISTSAPAWIGRGDRRHTVARYVRVTLTGGPSLCLGELRVLGDSRRAPATIGHDLSFAIQEAAIGSAYWQPEWIPGVGWTPGEGTPNDNLTMFDFSGAALPSVQFLDPLRACREFAPGQAPCTF